MWDKGELYIIEVNPRSSRTVPYITKVTGVPVIELATRVMLGETLKEMGYASGILPESSLTAVKVPVFSTEKLPMVEVSLGPEMRSTGEVLGIGKDFTEALFKGFTAAQTDIPKTGSVLLVTVRDRDKENFLPLAKRLSAMGCHFIATDGTGTYLRAHGIPVQTAKKISEGVPNVLDIIRSGICSLIIDLPQKGNDKGSDGFKIRRTAAESSVTLMTALDTVKAMTDIMEQNFAENQLMPIAIQDI